MLKRPLKDYEKLFLNSMFDVIVASLQVKAHFTERTNFKAAGTWAYEKKSFSSTRSFETFVSLTFRVTLGKLQAYCLGHVRIEAYTLLQILFDNVHEK